MKRILIISAIVTSLFFTDIPLSADFGDVFGPTAAGAIIGGAAGGGKGAAIGAGVGLGASLIASSARDNQRYYNRGYSRNRSRKRMRRELRDLKDRRAEIRDDLRFAYLSERKRANLREELYEINREIRALKRDLGYY